MYNFFFFDLDDTLWDFHSNARNSLMQIYEHRGLQQHFESFDTFFSIYAKKNIELWEAYGNGEITKTYLMKERFRYPLSRMGIDDTALAEEIGHQYLEILPTQKKMMPHSREVLEKLSEKFPLTLISNGFTDTQHKKIDSSGIRHYFNHIILSEEAGYLKPDTRIFELALKLNGASKNETLMIGDSWAADIVGAASAGIDQVYYRANKNFPENQPATYKMADLREIFSLL